MNNTDNTFEWNDVTVNEFCKWHNSPSCKVFETTQDAINSFKESKKNKEQPIVITELKEHEFSYTRNNKNKYLYQFCSSKSLEGKDSDSIKQAIEKVLNEPIPTPVVEQQNKNNNSWLVEQIKLHEQYLKQLTDKVFGEQEPVVEKDEMKRVLKEDNYTFNSTKTEKGKYYEILALKGGYMNENDILIELGSDKKYYAKGLPIPIEIDYLLNICKSKIQSVRRLSDGITFSIGDIILREPQDNKICEFRLLDNGEMIAVFNYGGFSNINFIKKDTNDKEQPKPQEDKVLFTTDEVPFTQIFDGTPYAIVELPSYNVSRSIGMVGAIRHPNQLYFSTKEKAEEFILMNKPCLSYMDLKEWGLHSESLKCLISKIQQKLHN